MKKRYDGDGLQPFAAGDLLSEWTFHRKGWFVLFSTLTLRITEQGSFPTPYRQSPRCVRVYVLCNCLDPPFAGPGDISRSPRVSMGSVVIYLMSVVKWMDGEVFYCPWEVCVFFVYVTRVRSPEPFFAM